MSPENRTSKPSAIAHENNLINKGNTIELSVKDFIKHTVAPYSRTWCGAVLSGERKNSNFVATQVLALDVDNKNLTKDESLTPDNVVDRCKEYGISPTFIYSSFSHSIESPRFRIVFVLDQAITDSTTASLAIETLRKIFPEADNTTDISRMWFGGKETLYENPDYNLPIKKLEELYNLNLIPLGGRNIKRALKDSNDNWCKNENALYNTIGDSPNCTNYLPQHENKLEKFDWEFAKQECFLLRKLLNGTEKVWHNDLLILASNMFRIKGGEKRFKEAVLAHPLISNEKVKIIHYIKYRWGTPNSILPISFKHIYSNNMEDRQVINKYRNLLKIRPTGQYSKATLVTPLEQAIPVVEARAKMKSEFERIMEEDSNKIYVVKCATGLGKTSLAINQEKVAIFFPNHALKDEKSEEARIEHVCTPNLPESLPDDLKTRYEDLCKCGLYTHALSELIKFTQAPRAEHLTVSNEIKTYLNQIISCKQSQKTVFSTHARGAIANFVNHHTYIFDEDPLHQLVRFEKITTKDLRIIAKGLQDIGQTNDSELVYTLAEHLKSGIGFLMTDISPINFQAPELVATVISSKKKSLSGDVFSLLCNDTPIKYILEAEDSEDPKGEKCIHYVNYRKLLDDKKYIILSATADEWIYKKLYGDRVEVIDLSNVEMKGKIIQFSNKSFSRTAMKSEERLNTVNNFLQSLNTITFLKYKDKVVNSVEDIHFGKVEGFNSLSGENFKVAGTFHLSRSHYLLFAKFLGIQLHSLDLVLRREMVHNNGFKFNFFTFENRDLRRIQFYFIEKELKQAVGRARLLDNESTVFVFSEYPIPRAEQFCLKEAPQVEQEYLAQAA